MKTINKYVGLDVHKDTTVIAVAEKMAAVWSNASMARCRAAYMRWKKHCARSVVRA